MNIMQKLYDKIHLSDLHTFLKATVISNARLKLAKYQANTKQHLEAELLLCGNYSHSSCENNKIYFRN